MQRNAENAPVRFLCFPLQASASPRLCVKAVGFSNGLSGCRIRQYVGVRKIIALEQQGFPCRLGQGIGETVAEV